MNPNQPSSPRYGLVCIGCFILFVIAIVAFVTVNAKAHEEPPAPAALLQLAEGLTADQRSLLVETFREFAKDQKRNQEYYSTTPADYAFWGGKALAFEHAAYFLENWKPGTSYSPR